MKKITFIYYRSWAHNILLHIIKLQKIRRDFEIAAVIIPKDHSLTKDLLRLKLNVVQVEPSNCDQVANAINKIDGDLVFAFSWSWKIPSSIIKSKICLCLHPSNLPSYAGGSPIQNQVFDGLYDSKVSVFKMTDELDHGPIYMQTAISLFGGIEEVFERMAGIGRSISEQVISDYLADRLEFKEFPTHQKHLKHYYKRRKNADSEPLIHNLKAVPFNALAQKIKILLLPYPNAFLSIGSSKIKIKAIQRINKIEIDHIVLDGNIQHDVQINKKYVLILKDGCALISNFEVFKPLN